jgi:hypothetical protein
VPAVALWTPEDAVLGALAPLGAALAAPPCLVIDLDPHGPRYPGDRSLADLTATDPTERDLTPRNGVAVLRNGGVSPSDAAAVVEGLLQRWPRVVLRLPPRLQPQSDIPIVPVRLLIGGFLSPPSEPAVWQATPRWVPPPRDGVVLPVPERGTVDALLTGRRPVRSRWIRAWRSLWSASWMD